MNTKNTPLAKPSHFIEFLEFARADTLEQIKQAEIIHNRRKHLHDSRWLNVFGLDDYVSWENSYALARFNNTLESYSELENMALYYQAMDTADFQTLPVPENLQAEFYTYCRENNLPNSCEY